MQSSRIFLVLVLLAIALPATAQQTLGTSTGYSKDVQGMETPQSDVGNPPTYTPPSKAKPVPDFLPALVKKQFGPDFEIFPGPETPLLTGDFDADGVEDAVIVVRAQHPMANIAAYDVTAFSPEDEYYGYGDPAVMAATEFQMWQRQKLLLVIHGRGAEGWRAEKPKGKYLLVNLPFQHVFISRTRLKKKLVDVISGESSSLTSVVYWNGKKYKYEPVGTVE